MTSAELCRRLEPPVDNPAIVLDTDAYNEIDDQFAICYALLCPERLKVEAVYAAPFHNRRSDGPGDGMRKSRDEITRLLDRLGRDAEGLVFDGSDSFLAAADSPVTSPAADDLIQRAASRSSADNPLYVVAIGAPTNIASAILLQPAIRDRIVVVWLGGQPHHAASAREFNLQQDLHATHILLDSGIPLVQIPCSNVAQHLRTTPAEIEQFLRGRSAIAEYLCDIFCAWRSDEGPWSKEIWDVAPVAWLVDSGMVSTHLAPTPILTSELTWSHDPRRPLMRVADGVKRDLIFSDLFRRLSAG